MLSRIPEATAVAVEEIGEGHVGLGSVECAGPVKVDHREVTMADAATRAKISARKAKRVAARRTSWMEPYERKLQAQAELDRHVSEHGCDDIKFES